MLIQTMLYRSGLPDAKIRCDHCSKRADIQFLCYAKKDLYWCRGCALELIRALAVDLGDLHKPVKPMPMKRRR
jgi:hypothetical protein